MHLINLIILRTPTRSRKLINAKGPRRGGKVDESSEGPIRILTLKTLPLRSKLDK